MVPRIAKLALLAAALAVAPAASAGADPIYQLPPTVAAAPAVVGMAQVGSTLQVTDARFNGADTVTRVWQSCAAAAGPCTDLPATGQTYVPLQSDVGRFIRVHEVGGNSAGSVSSDSPAVGPVTAVPLKPTLKLLVVLMRAPKLSGRTVSFTIRCLPGACRAKVGGRLLVAKRKRAIKLGTVSASLKAGRDRRMSFRLRGADASTIHAALKAHRKVLARLTGSATDTHGHRATFLSTTRL